MVSQPVPGPDVPSETQKDDQKPGKKDADKESPRRGQKEKSGSAQEAGK